MSTSFKPSLRLVGLHGFLIGRLGRYFSAGWFPYKGNWGRRHQYWLVSEYTKRFGDDPYIVVGFSDGATLAHEVGAIDERCQGVIAHSGMFREPTQCRHIPVLLLRTCGDLTPTFEATAKAAEWYGRHGVATRPVTLSRHTAIGHEFANGLLTMNQWSVDHFGLQLPIRDKHLTVSA